MWARIRTSLPDHITRDRPSACSYSAILNTTQSPLQSASHANKQARDHRSSWSRLCDFQYVGFLITRSNLDAGICQAIATYTRAPQISSMVTQMAVPDYPVSPSRFIVLRDPRLWNTTSCTLRTSCHSVTNDNRHEEDSPTCTPSRLPHAIGNKLKPESQACIVGYSVLTLKPLFVLLAGA